MPCGTWVIINITPNRIGTVEAETRLDNPRSVTRMEQPDKNWTLTAVFGPCPDGTNPVQVKDDGQS